MADDYRGALTVIQNSLDSHTLNLTPVKSKPTEVSNERTYQPSRKYRLSDSMNSLSNLVDDDEDFIVKRKDEGKNLRKGGAMTQIASK
jgi:hypothetical protein